MSLNTIGDYSMSSRLSAVNIPCAIIVDFSEVIYNFTPTTTRHAYLFSGALPLINLMHSFTVADIIEASLIYDYDNPSHRHVVWEVLEARFWNGYADFWDHSESVETLNILVDLIAEEADKKIKDVLTPYRLDSEYGNYLFHHWLGAGAAMLTHKYYEKNS